ncbi:metallophosphoesterase family protein [uncultured Chitinophaga sp.]|uniref:metallophosphoesterase family protein n=1 Tax=uncultured Chitinophaga sp. TaxID=339340 RepID=UPI0025E162DF|nr:metallophosphoesterase family protein [uncultured Chitinophaga sp.]
MSWTEKNKRTFAIGDVHGALKALQQIVSLIKPQSHDTLIFLGDYVDGWPESAQVIDYLVQLEKQCHCIFIKGNHDVTCETWLAGNLQKPEWLLKAGRLTVKSYEGYSKRQLRTHLEFFSRMKYFYIDKHQRLFVHGGFTAAEGPSAEPVINNLTKDRTLWEMALTMDKRVKDNPALFPKKMQLFDEIYIGHTPTLNYDVTVPMKACNIYNVDTGAAFYGSLSAIDLDTKEVLQTDVVQLLYPDYQGKELKVK